MVAGVISCVGRFRSDINIESKHLTGRELLMISPSWLVIQPVFSLRHPEGDAVSSPPRLSAGVTVHLRASYTRMAIPAPNTPERTLTLQISFDSWATNTSQPSPAENKSTHPLYSHYVS